MEYLIGAGLAMVVGTFALLTGFDRDRAFYPIVLVVIASYYILFATIGRSMSALGLECLTAGVFAALAVAGSSKKICGSLWVPSRGMECSICFITCLSAIPVSRCGGRAFVSRSTFSRPASLHCC